ncbi:MAG: recombination factor protein RarA, partial [Casimicrobiaceae bacterium]
MPIAAPSDLFPPPPEDRADPPTSAAATPVGDPIADAPLAERLRPATIDDVVGQRHLLAPGRPLAIAFASGKPHS